MRRIWIVAVGVLALGFVAALAIVGVAPDGGHTWIDSIQTALNCAVDKVTPTGGHTWID